MILLQHAVVAKAAVEVVVLPQVGHRRDAPAQVIDALLKAALLRQVRIAVAQVPLAEQGRACSRRPRKSRPSSGCRARMNDRPAQTLVAPLRQRVHAGHELAARRRTHRRHVKVGQPDALPWQRPSSASSAPDCRERKIAVALVVAEHDDTFGRPAASADGRRKISGRAIANAQTKS